jgi:hypothetical protein
LARPLNKFVSLFLGQEKALPKALAFLGYGFLHDTTKYDLASAIHEGGKIPEIVHSADVRVERSVGHHAVAILNLQKIEQRRGSSLQHAFVGAEYSVARIATASPHYQFPSHESGKDVLVCEVFFSETENAGHLHILLIANVGIIRIDGGWPTFTPFVKVGTVNR